MLGFLQNGQHVQGTGCQLLVETQLRELHCWERGCAASGEWGVQLLCKLLCWDQSDLRLCDKQPQPGLK